MAIPSSELNREAINAGKAAEFSRLKTIPAAETNEGISPEKVTDTEIKREEGGKLARLDSKKTFIERLLSKVRLPWFKKKDEVLADTQKSSATGELISLPQTKVFLPTDFDNIIAMKNHHYKREDFFKFGLPERFSSLIRPAEVEGNKVDILENIAWHQLAYDLYQGFAFEKGQDGKLEPKILNNRYVSVVVTRNPYEMAQEKLSSIESPILNTLKPSIVTREQLGTKEEANELAGYSPNKGRFSFFKRALFIMKHLITEPKKAMFRIKKYGLAEASLKPPTKWLPLLMPDSEFATKDGKKIKTQIPVLIDDTPNNNGGNKAGDGYQPEFLSDLRDPKKFIEMTLNSGIDKNTGVFDARKTDFYQRLVKELILPLEEQGPEAFLKSKGCNTTSPEIKAISEFKEKHAKDTVQAGEGKGRPLLSYHAIQKADEEGVYEQEFLGQIKMSQLKEAA